VHAPLQFPDFPIRPLAQIEQARRAHLAATGAFGLGLTM
jgi:hypothetical protein